MAQPKKYTEPQYYEGKLARVMERLGTGADYQFNFDRHGAWVEFRYKTKLYRFDHTVEKAQDSGQDIHYGSDCFAQIVLALEDLTRIIERGIYELDTWVAGMQFLPPPIELPECFRLLGFTEMPGAARDVQARYKTLAKQYHPDAGGNQKDFEKIKAAAEQAMRHMEAGR